MIAMPKVTPVDLVRIATAEEAHQALRILIEAARWSERFGEPIWPAEAFTIAEQVAVAKAGELIGGFSAGVMVGCMRLQRRDLEFWPDDVIGDALYIHKVAVSREAAGTGWVPRLLSFAEEQARRRGIGRIRLDTLPQPRLLRLYSDLGFMAVNESPRSYGERWMIRMERIVRPKASPDLDRDFGHEAVTA